MRLEGSDSLIHQRNAVSEEQHSLGPVASHQQLAQRDDGPGLPAPVAMTTRVLRWFSRSNDSAMRRMARL